MKCAPLLLAAALLAGGCAPKNWNHEEDGAFDPFEPLNRQTYKLNKGLDTLVLRPLAKGYSNLPAPVRTGIGNFYRNLSEPGNALNNTLQRKGKGAIGATARFAFNTVLGLGGLVDVASHMDIPYQPAGFGQTLRGYGLSDTAYFYLPLLGPSTMADGIGTAVDGTTRPHAYVQNGQVRTGLSVLEGVHTRAELLQVTDLIESTALDEYLFTRDAYEDLRQQETPARVWGAEFTGRGAAW